MDNFNSVGILGVGSYTPDKTMTNFDLEKMVDTSDEWITQRTGISERKIQDEGKYAYEMGVEAARIAIGKAGIKPQDLDMIIVATISPDYLSPASACLVQDKLEAYQAAALDVNAACTGFIYAMSIAEQYIKTGFYNYILIIGCEGLSRVTDWSDRNSCVLLGDAAGAVVLGKVEKGYGFIDTILAAEGNLGNKLTIPCCYLNEEEKEKRPSGKYNTFRMDGKEVYKFATRVMHKAIADIIEKTGYSIDDIKYIVPHQANIKIIKSAAKKLNINESKIIINIQKYGNTSSATIPLALNEEVVMKDKLNKGDIVIFVAFGGGLTWGVSMIKWV